MKLYSKEQFTHFNYAHRGLHDISNQIPENSLCAFQKAVEQGYGIELDVQLSKDGQVVVFHDDDLKRVCGIDERVDYYNYDELKEFRLLDTDHHIPLFKEVLEVLKKGNGPLIVELKTGNRNDELCEKTLEILKTYPKVYCIESFNPFIVKWFKKHANEVFRGQLAAPKEDYMPAYNSFIASILSKCMFSIINKPDFIAYKNGIRPKRVLRLRKKGVLLFGWTSRVCGVDQESNDAVIFEQYKPTVKY